MVKASLPLPCWVRLFWMLIIRWYFLSFSKLCSMCNFCTCSKFNSVLRPLWARYASNSSGQTTDQGRAIVSEVLYLYKNAVFSVIPSIDHSKLFFQHIQCHIIKIVSSFPRSTVTYQLDRVICKLGCNMLQWYVICQLSCHNVSSGTTCWFYGWVNSISQLDCSSDLSIFQLPLLLLSSPLRLVISAAVCLLSCILVYELQPIFKLQAPNKGPK